MINSKSIIVIAGMVLATQFTGCLSVKSYVDPAYKSIRHSEIKRLDQPIPIVISTEFQKNGVSAPEVNKVFYPVAVRSLRTTGVFEPLNQPNGQNAKLLIVANNVADLGEAATKGVLTGLTFGAVGNAIADKYEFKFKYIDVQGKEISQNYPHVILSTVGNTQAPIVNVPPMNINEAFNQVVDDVIIRFTYDLQQQK